MKTKNGVAATHKQNEKSAPLPFRAAFLAPKYWGVWLGLFLLLPLVFLPLRWQFFVGRQLGRLAYRLSARRRQDTLTNLALAFPKKSDTERKTLAQQVFMNQGVGIFESLCAWYRPEKFARSFRVSGAQRLIQAQKQGRAVLLLGMHGTTLDLGGRIATQFFALDCVYRPQNNPLLDWLIYNARRGIFEAQIPHKNIRQLATRLKQGKVVWYSPDQDFGLEHGVMAPFFGVDAATITAPRRLAKMGDKKNPPVVLVMHFFRQSPDFVGGRFVGKKRSTACNLARLKTTPATTRSPTRRWSIGASKRAFAKRRRNGCGFIAASKPSPTAKTPTKIPTPAKTHKAKACTDKNLRYNKIHFTAHACRSAIKSYNFHIFAARALAIFMNIH